MAQERPAPTADAIAKECGVSRQAVCEYFRRHGVKKPHATKYVDQQRFCHSCGQEFTWTRAAQSNWHLFRDKGIVKSQAIVCSLKCAGKIRRKDVCWICKQGFNEGDPVYVFQVRNHGEAPYAVHKPCWKNYKASRDALLTPEQKEARLQKARDYRDRKRREEADRIHAERYGLSDILDQPSGDPENG